MNMAIDQIIRFFSVLKLNDRYRKAKQTKRNITLYELNVKSTEDDKLKFFSFLG